MTSNPDVAGKVALITGASRGIGAGIAQYFLRHGMLIGICARTTPAIPQVPGVPPAERVLASSVDVRDCGALEGFADQVVARFGRIDLWVNNAGVLSPIGPLRDCDPALIAANVETNVTGVAFGSRIFARHVRSRPGGGTLINITSGAAKTPYEGWAAYCGSKAAVDMITEVVAVEERDAGLRAHAVAPGVADTAMQEMIRSCTPEQFPAVGRFLQIASEGAFKSIEWIADRLIDLAFADAKGTRRPVSTVIRL